MVGPGASSSCPGEAVSQQDAACSVLCHAGVQNGSSRPQHPDCPGAAVFTFPGDNYGLNQIFSPTFDLLLGGNRGRQSRRDDFIPVCFEDRARKVFQGVQRGSEVVCMEDAEEAR